MHSKIFQPPLLDFLFDDGVPDALDILGDFTFAVWRCRRRVRAEGFWNSGQWGTGRRNRWITQVPQPAQRSSQMPC
jgi:hypothetical protein